MGEVIVYLDFDGVLNGRATRGPDPMRDDPIALAASALSPQRARLVDRLCHEAGASIVVHSSWRLSWTYTELVALLREVGIMAPIIGVAPVHAVARDLAISADIAARKPRAYVILDDEDWFRYDPWAEDRVITTNWDRGGITDQDVEDALQAIRDQLDARGEE